MTNLSRSSPKGSATGAYEHAMILSLYDIKTSACVRGGEGSDIRGIKCRFETYFFVNKGIQDEVLYQIGELAVISVVGGWVCGAPACPYTVRAVNPSPMIAKPEFAVSALTMNETSSAPSIDFERNLNDLP
jgi:hypothetical protein